MVNIGFVCYSMGKLWLQSNLFNTKKLHLQGIFDSNWLEIWRNLMITQNCGEWENRLKSSKWDRRRCEMWLQRKHGGGGMTRNEKKNRVKSCKCDGIEREASNGERDKQLEVIASKLHRRHSNKTKDLGIISKLLRWIN